MKAIGVRPAVTLEPELECEVALMNIRQRRTMAKKFERWAHQLWISASILERRQRPLPPRSSLKALPARKQALN